MKLQKSVLSVSSVRKRSDLCVWDCVSLFLMLSAQQTAYWSVPMTIVFMMLQLHQSIESLKEENEKLLELASQAEYLSSLLQVSKICYDWWLLDYGIWVLIDQGVGCDEITESVKTKKHRFIYLFVCLFVVFLRDTWTLWQKYHGMCIGGLNILVLPILPLPLLPPPPHLLCLSTPRLCHEDWYEDFLFNGW